MVGWVQEDFEVVGGLFQGDFVVVGGFQGTLVVVDGWVGIAGGQPPSMPPKPGQGAEVF